MPLEPLVETQELSLAHHSAPVLRDIDMSIAPGEIVTIVGPNGSGKSTLIKGIIGALAPTAGRVIRAAGLRIGYVPQQLALGDTMPMTVDRFLSLPRRMPRAIRQAALTQAGLEGQGSAQLRSLSGGQFQRALLARALLGGPNLLVLDEPTQGLDQPGAADFYRRIEAVRDDLGCAVLMVSHDLHVVMAASDRVLCINGHICCQGTPEVVAGAPEYQALFGAGTQGALALYRHSHYR